MAEMCQVMRERAIGVLDAGMSIRAVSVLLNVNHSTKARLTNWKSVEQATVVASTRDYPCTRSLRPTSALKLVIPLRIADETVGVSNRRISAQTVRNCL